MTGIEVGPGLTAAQKMWRMFTAFGDIAIAYTYTPVLIEVQVNYNQIYIYLLMIVV